VAHKFRVLWCPGNPGVGKTILVATIIEHLLDTFVGQDTIVLLIYCNYKKQYGVHQLMEALLRQLALHCLTSDNLALLEEQRDKLKPLSLGKLMVLLQTEVKTHSCVFIIIDALDGYSDGVQKEFIAKIPSLTSVKILVTSRPILSIEHNLAADSKLEITAKDSDINAYLETQLSSPHADMLRRLLSKPSSQISKKDIINRVAMKAQGMFLLARLHTDSLCAKSTLRSLRQTLDKLPDSFKDTYDNALARIDRQSEEQRKLAYQVFS